MSVQEVSRREIASIIDSTPFRAVYVDGPFKDETEKEKWLRARSVAFYKADMILALLADRQARPGAATCGAQPISDNIHPNYRWKCGRCDWVGVRQQDRPCIWKGVRL